MRRLFWKLFGAFWLTTVVILAAAIFVSFKLANEQSGENFADPREVDAQLQSILQSTGIDGLRSFIEDPESFPPGQTVYLIDETGKDLLGRTLPEQVQRRTVRMWAAIAERRYERRNGDRWQRRLRQSLLEMADGRLLLAMPGPAPLPRFGWLSYGNGRWAILALAAAISFLGFWLLSRSLTGPVGRISTTAARLADGDMAARVGADTYSADEIGQLAGQFDRMAEELEAQSKNRREMFRNIAHELRAPLTRLQLATELLERKPATAAENLARIRYEIERVEKLASQVLTLARAEQTLDSDEVTALPEVLEQIARDAEFEAAARGVEFSYECTDSNIALRGNADAIASAIENVVRNAVHHTPAGGEVRLLVENRESCRVTISDSGPGVPDNALDRIFEPFVRIDTNQPGAGIGLAIAKRVVHQLGGQIVASNRPGGGLQVTMSFPQRPASNR
ncbi:MAG: HAMP domain-containing sensor histidine kinase, partial [Woeseia sp.]